MDNISAGIINTRVFKFLFVLAIFLSVFNIVFTQSSELEKFSNNDRVCFIGNSITHGGSYHSLIYLFYLTRYPDMDVRFFNCGVSGGMASGANRRFEGDIMVKNPSHATLMFGMNDVGGWLYSSEPTGEILLQRKQNIMDYVKNIDTLVQKLINNNVSVIFFTPTIYDETAEIETANHPGQNEALRKCKAIIERKAASIGAPVVDLHGILDSLNRELQYDDPAFTIIGKDRVHPGIDGHFVMAYEFLKTQDHPPIISRIEMDAKTYQAGELMNCEIHEVLKTENGFSFTCTEGSLPFPLPENLLANRWVPFADINQEILKIEKLEPGDYKLTIDDVTIGVFSANDLDKGINLSNYPEAPQYQQAILVSELNEWRRLLEQNRLRSLALYDFGWFWLEDDKSLAEKELLFVEKLKPLMDKPFYGYLRRQADNYLQFKPLENESKMQIEEITKALNTINKPLPHKYLIEFADND